MKYLEDRDLTLHQGDVREVLRELSPSYCELAARRLSQLSLLAEAT